LSCAEGVSEVVKPIVEILASAESPIKAIVENLLKIAGDVYDELKPWIKAATIDLKKFGTFLTKEIAKARVVAKEICKDAQQVAEKLLRQLLEILEKAADKLQATVNNSGASQEIKDIITNLKAAIKKAAKSQDIDLSAIVDIYQLILRGLTQRIHEVLEIDLSIAETSLQLTIPNLVPSVWQLINFIGNPLSYVPNYNLLQWLNVPLYPISPNHFIIPPSGRAWISGDKITTFDGHTYTLKNPKCQYILAADFVSKNLTLMIDFATRSIILADQELTLEIKTDNTVILNKEVSQLPFEKGSSLKVQEVWGGIAIQAPRLSILCNDNHEHCTIDIDGFLFAHTRGLLGTFNNEECDDLTSPAGLVIEDVNAFAKTWKVNRRCTE